MLDSIGLSNASELFRSIPADVQLDRKLKITDPLAEPEVIRAMEEMAARNTAATKPSFLGAGVYSLFRRKGLRITDIEKAIIAVVVLSLLDPG